MEKNLKNFKKTNSHKIIFQKTKWCYFNPLLRLTIKAEFPPPSDSCIHSMLKTAIKNYCANIPPKVNPVWLHSLSIFIGTESSSLARAVQSLPARSSESLPILKVSRGPVASYIILKSSSDTSSLRWGSELTMTCRKPYGQQGEVRTRMHFGKHTSSPLESSVFFPPDYLNALACSVCLRRKNTHHDFLSQTHMHTQVCCYNELQFKVSLATHEQKKRTKTTKVVYI